jgi:hypothetical protein
MSRARHRAKGGSVKKDWYAGEGSNAAKEAEEKKKGGRVHGEGEMGKKRHDRARARGGMIPGRKSGGGVGANLTPLSTAARVKHLPGTEKEDEHKSD